MSAINLKVGGRYSDRQRNTVVITEHKPMRVFPFGGDNGRTYKQDGRWDIGKSGDMRDLISVVDEPAEQTSPGLEKAVLQGKVDELRDPKTKATNPKAAIGVRKVPFSVIPQGVIAEVGVGMLEGTAKYGRHNYREAGVRSSVYFDATMRHLIAWWEGQDIDPDSGMSHITKAITSLVVLRDAQMQGKEEDDRPPRSAEFFEPLNKLAGEVLDRHADKAPHHYTEKERAQ